MRAATGQGNARRQGCDSSPPASWWDWRPESWLSSRPSRQCSDRHRHELQRSSAGSLPDAVANAAAGDTITFASGLTCPPASPIILTSTMTITQDLTINGPGASTMAVSGNNSVGVLAIDVGTLNISGLTIEGAEALSARASPFSQGP